ncbi:hypothetical protein B0G71_4676 [Paraburkholderia sp. BL27I4N3]|uniref:hypothetical protein n=1 Tax=Paraburkholderia sp. BL27I4N3 TaxID=1938805 RepID=UPI000E3A1B70|nr:hypothetical protein [Paraburkholderia sp. BL27I4N3]REE21499.1 hypothetical protein B0G71_4676 [Paraburkholderia sp. BL27I4N3]
MKESAIYADFEIISETMPEQCAGGGCVWVDTVARHAVSGEIVYACIEPFGGAGTVQVSERIAVGEALEHARDSLRHRLGRR